MTFAAFLHQVLAIIEPRGAPYTTVATEQKAALNERLYAFTKRTRCLYSVTATIDLVQNQAMYSMITGPSVPMVSIEDGTFFVNSAVLTRIYLDDLVEDAPTWKTDAASVPTHYSIIPGAVDGQPGLMVYPKPDAAYAACPLSGHPGHTQYKTDGSDDTDPILVPYDDTHTAAVFCAVGLMYPAQSSLNDLQLMAAIDASAASRMRSLESEARQVLTGVVRRGAGRGSRRLYSL
jgi:hypothetical protein